MFFRRLLPFALLATALAIAGCGRRGPLEAPPGSAAAAPQAAPAPQASRGLGRDTSDPNLPGSTLTAPGAAVAPKTPFVLDPLVD